MKSPFSLVSVTGTGNQAAIRQKFLGAMESNGARQKVVPASEVKRHIKEGGSTRVPARRERRAQAAGVIFPVLTL